MPGEAGKRRRGLKQVTAGIYRLENQLMMILDVDCVLDIVPQTDRRVRQRGNEARDGGSPAQRSEVR